MNKKIIITVLLIGFVGYSTALTIQGVGTEPTEPLINDTINITSTIDGENHNIEDTNLTVTKNNESLLNLEPMTMVSGSDDDLSFWRYEDAFTIDEPENNEDIYDVVVESESSNGSIDDYSIQLNVNETVEITETDDSETDDSETDDSETDDSETDDSGITDKRIFDLKVKEVGVLGFILVIIYILLEI